MQREEGAGCQIHWDHLGGGGGREGGREGGTVTITFHSNLMLTSNLIKSCTLELICNYMLISVPSIVAAKHPLYGSPAS